jgi:hypothetical protein
MGIFEYENSSGSAAGIKLEESTSSEKELSEKRNKIVDKKGKGQNYEFHNVENQKEHLKT